MKITNRQLYTAAPISEKNMYDLLQKSPQTQHTFSESFEKKVAKTIESSFPKHSRCQKGFRLKRAFIVAAIVLLLTGLTLTVNAMTDGALLRGVQNILLGYTNGPHSTFVYGKTDGLSIDDFPEGTYKTEAVFFDGSYYLDDHTKIPMNKIIFLNPAADIANGDKTEILLLP